MITKPHPTRVHNHCDNKKHDDCIACQTTETLDRLIKELDELMALPLQQRKEFFKET